MSFLELADIWRHYNRRPILAGIKLQLENPTKVIVSGKNGAGKSTLLRIIAGTLQPTKGNVLVQGKVGVQARQEIAYVPQDSPVYRELSVLEHLQFAHRVRRNVIARQTALQTLADGNIHRLADQSAGNLSRGQRQRLCLVVAFSLIEAGKASLLVLDEPFTALDDEGEKWLTAKLNQVEGGWIIADHGHPGVEANQTWTIDAGSMVPTMQGGTRAIQGRQPKNTREGPA